MIKYSCLAPKSIYSNIGDLVTAHHLVKYFGWFILYFARFLGTTQIFSSWYLFVKSFAFPYFLLFLRNQKLGPLFCFWLGAADTNISVLPTLQMSCTTKSRYHRCICLGVTDLFLFLICVSFFRCFLCDLSSNTSVTSMTPFIYTKKGGRITKLVLGRKFLYSRIPILKEEGGE
jgi:hypothetical protein